MNPLNETKPDPEPFWYPFRVCYVGEPGVMTKPAYFERIKAFCEENHVVFMARLYQPRKYDEDSEFIERLPAFHVYLDRNLYHDTFYQGMHEMSQVIQRFMHEYDEKLIKAREKAEQRAAYWNGVVASFKELFRKKTRMEKMASKAKSEPKSHVMYKH
jgi:hypothetical protein